jgi:hypothetical protein
MEQAAATKKQQVKFSIRVVSEEIDKMLADGASRHLFYDKIAKGERLYGRGVLEEQLTDVIMVLQAKYRDRATVSRSPGGIVVDRLNSSDLTKWI